MEGCAMDALVLALLTWINDKTAYDTTSMPLPAIVEVSAEEITQEAYKDTPDLMPASGVDARVFALYTWEPSDTGTVYILRAAETEGLQLGEDPLENPVFQERLLHELIHHVQYHSNAYTTFPCKNYGELEAYIAGGRYLQERHATDPLPNRYVLAHMYSRC
jgi:hypothetical protein